MRRFGSWVLGLLALLVVACGGDDRTGGNGNPNESIDTDGDGISDVDETSFDNNDCDNDGTPNIEDTDSDNDGIPDAQEARPDGQPNTVGEDPFDSDADGIPNFCSTDSDGNGIPDAEEPGLDVDSDGDGLPDRNDADDDNDRLTDAVELDGIFDPPVDSDNDGVPNYLDPDSDGDGILDGDEFNEDSDGDGLKNWEDPDSDDDGILDKDEGGNGGDPRVPPVDTDGDRIPDFLDLDSDNDGLSDAKELELGTNRISADTDNDGVTDLIEVAAGTDVFDENDNPRTRGDFVFTIPYEEVAEPRTDTLNFRTNIQFADMYILFDQTTSMDGELKSLREALTVAVSELTCDDFQVPCLGDSSCQQEQVCGAGGTCIESPRATSCIESFYTGFGMYEDDLTNFVSLQPDPSVTVAALGNSTKGAAEQPLEAIMCMLDAASCVDGTQCATSGIGCVGYRPDAARIVLNVTDDGDDCGTVGTSDPDCDALEFGAVKALVDNDVRYVGINANATFSETGQDQKARALMDYLTTESGSVNNEDEPLIVRGADSAATDALITAIQEVVKNVPLKIELEPMEDTGDAGNILHIIDKIETNNSGNDPCVRHLQISDGNADGTLDTFDGVLPGEPVCWDVTVKDNSEAVLGDMAIEATEDPQVFRLRMVVRGNGAVVDERTAYFLVPPKIDQFEVPR